MLETRRRERGESRARRNQKLHGLPASEIYTSQYILMCVNFRGGYTFLHELCHVFGAHHNKESGANNKAYKYGYGKLFKWGGGYQDGYRTIMA